MIEFELFGIISILLCSIIDTVLIKKKMRNKRYIFADIAVVFYIAFLIKVAFFPIPFEKDTIEMLRENSYGASINYRPLYTIIGIIKSSDLHNMVFQLAGNLIMLFPLGFYMGVTIQKKLGKLALFIALTSITIEIMQFLIGIIIDYQYRIVDVDDVLLNVLGGIVGVLIGLLIKPLYNMICAQIINDNHID